jgi:cytochrome c biogenesis protein CcmG/thiol:disulfide interchange protein DsbE
MRAMLHLRRRGFPTWFALMALLWMAASCGRSAPDGVTPDANVGPLARNAVSAPLLPTHVAELPAFDVDAFRELLTQLRGTPVVVNVWAAWCGPCKTEAPLLADASHAYGDRVQFLGVDILDSLDGARGFIAEHGLEYPSVFDPSGSIRDSLGMVGQPVTVFYDADGNVASSYPGELSRTVLQAGIRAALGES